jgi:hypothetical protein
MAVTQVSDVSGSIEKIVSGMLTETLIQESVCIGSSAIMDLSSEVRPGMDRVDVPLLAALAVQDVSETAAVTAQTISSSEAQLSLNRHKSIPFALGDRVAMQSKINLIQEAVKNGAKSLAAEIDDHILGLIDAGASTAAPDHRLALTASDPLADIRNSKKLLDVQNVGKMGRVIFASPGFIEELLGTNNIIRANEYGGAEALKAGFVTRIYGFDILETSSSSVTGDGFFACGMNTYAFARQIMPKFEKERNVLAHRDEYSLSHLYGAVAAQGSDVRTVVYDADGL